MEQELIKRIEALEKWKAERERQQITLPLDSVSKTVLTENLFPPTGKEIAPTGLLGAPFYTLQTYINGVENWLAVSGKN